MIRSRYEPDDPREADPVPPVGTGRSGLSELEQAKLDLLRVGRRVRPRKSAASAVKRHPWLVVAGAVAAGIVVSRVPVARAAVMAALAFAGRTAVQRGVGEMLRRARS